ncbi:MAG TPA: PIN domain-containing protein [Streptosporangiaceae bacterium]|jgi:predicted nucleic acid-binding protein|nr:PIN domain-containing protein [Streptosporangiaceae bacterium]
MAGLPAGIGGTLILDCEGIAKLASGDSMTRIRFEAARRRSSQVITAAPTLAEVLRGTPRDAAMHRVLNRITVVPIDKRLGRAAGELLGRAGLSGHRHALDALLAVVALEQQRPIVLLTSDPDDLSRLTHEPGRPARERVAVIRV